MLGKPRYTIKRCGRREIGAAMSFFAENHDPSHILASDREFVDWQYYTPEAESYNILIAQDGGGVLGLLAYIPNTFFDAAIPQGRKFVWTANWLAKKGYKGFVGLDLFRALPERENGAGFGVVGLTEEAGLFYIKMGYRVGRLEQYFFVNENISGFKILSGYAPRAGARRAPKAPLKKLDGLAGLDGAGLGASPLAEYLSAAVPRKSMAFFEKKYMKNPFYGYTAYVIEDGGLAAGLLICRAERHNGAKAIRLVEYAGEARHLAGADFQGLLDLNGAEYLDFYCAGLPGEVLLGAGFALNGGGGGLIVPNYFEPFQNKNIEIAYAYKSPECYIFKGDGDRDHPRGNAANSQNNHITLPRS